MVLVLVLVSVVVVVLCSVGSSWYWQRGGGRKVRKQQSESMLVRAWGNASSSKERQITGKRLACGVQVRIGLKERRQDKSKVDPAGTCAASAEV